MKTHEKIKVWIASRIRLAMLTAGRYQEGYLGEGAASIGYLAHAGLCNRLRSHLVAGIIARAGGRRLTLSWRRNVHCHLLGRDLFQPQPGADRGLVRVIEQQGGREIELIRDCIAARDHRLFLGEYWQYIDLATLRGILAAFPAEAQASVDALRERLVAFGRGEPLPAWPGRVIGIHIRRGDFAKFGLPTCPNSSYIACMREVLAADPGTGFAIYSDEDPAALQDFPREFGRHLLRLPSAPGERTSLDGMRTAVGDLCGLAACQGLILTKQSSFGDMAVILGGITDVRYAAR